jgi:hypothetical protein
MANQEQPEIDPLRPVGTSPKMGKVRRSHLFYIFWTRHLGE